MKIKTPTAPTPEGYHTSDLERNKIHTSENTGRKRLKLIPDLPCVFLRKKMSSSHKTRKAGNPLTVTNLKLMPTHDPPVLNSEAVSSLRGIVRVLLQIFAIIANERLA